MEWSEQLTRGTAQFAVACYLSRVGLDAWGSFAGRWKRGLWTLGFVALVLHIAAAFHFVHDWSHADALQRTAEQTEELTGWQWGGGVYINYAFAAFWLIDVISWWGRGVDFPDQSPTRNWMTQAVFAFLIFNATVVFGPSYWRYVGVVFMAICLTVWFTRNGLSCKNA